jgi:tetratricopeptide (TPR) repeat protein
MPEVRQHLEDAERLASHLEDTWRQGWTACYSCQYFWAVGEHDHALEAGDRACRIAERLEDVPLAAESEFYRGIALMARGRYQEAQRALSVSVDRVDAAIAAGKAFPSRRFGRNGPVIVRGFRAAALAELGRFDDGRRHGEAAVEIAEASESPFALVAAMTTLGALHVRKGELSTAIPLLTRGVAIAREHRLNNWFANVSANLGLAYVRAGRVGEGVLLLEESRRFVERSGVVVNRSLWLTYLAMGYLAMGESARARDVAEQALAMARSCGERGNQSHATYALARVLVEARVDSQDRAIALLRDALAIATELGQRPLQAECHVRLGAVLRAEDAATAADHAHRARALAENIGLLLADRIDADPQPAARLNGR